MDEVMDLVADEGIDDAAELDADIGEDAELEAEPAAEPVKAESEDPYTTKASREFRAATKAWEAANPEAAQFAKQARANHARLFALNQIEPGGIDGIREKYAVLEAIGGNEGLTGLQERLAGVSEVDALLAAANPEAFDRLPEEVQAGVIKMAPAYLDRVKQSDPELFNSAILPHFVQALAASDLVKDFNSLVDILNTTNDPRLDEKTKLNMTVTAIGRMAAWFNAQQEKAGTLKAGPTVDKRVSEFEQQRTEFEKQQQDAHWKTNIQPSTAQHEQQTFEKLFAPYNQRLKLDAAAKSDLMSAFKQGLTAAGRADEAYQRQMKIYKAQKNPDAAVVANFVKNSINKHSKTVMDALVKARYSPFLNGKPKTQAAVAANGKPLPPPAPGVEIRTVKPPMNEIDHQNTPLDWLSQKKYRLYSGKIIQVRA